MIKKVIAIYAGGFMTGVALIMFPGAGSILTDSAFHGFSGGQFGSIFTPQIITAILSSLLAPKLADKISMKNVLLAGLMLSTTSMLLLGGSHWLTDSQTVAYIIILMATAFSGNRYGDLAPAGQLFRRTFYLVGCSVFGSRSSASAFLLYICTATGAKRISSGERSQGQRV